jgi:hypothetical protein
MSNQFIGKSQQFLAEGKRRVVALPLEKQWFGSLVGFVIGFIFFANVLRFDPQNLLRLAHFAYLFLLCTAYIGVILLVAMAYKGWQGKRWDHHKTFPRTLMFFGHLAA